MAVSGLVGEDQCFSSFHVHATLIKMQILIQEVWVGASESSFFNKLLADVDAARLLSYFE